MPENALGGENSRHTHRIKNARPLILNVYEGDFFMQNKKQRFRSVPVLGALFFLGIELVLSRSPRFADAYEATVSARLRSLVSRLSGAIPFSLTEGVLWLLPVLALAILVLALRAASSRRGMRRALGFFFGAGLTFFALYVSLFSAGEKTTPLAERLAIPTPPPTPTELSACAAWLSELCATPVVPPDDAELHAALRRAYAAAGKRYGFTPNLEVRPKRTQTPLFRRLGFFGLYAFPFGEVTVASECRGAAHAFTLAHELAHASGFAREEEADLVAFLACLDSGDPYLTYAGAYGMLGRVLTVLAASAPCEWEQSSATLPEAVRRDFAEADKAAPPTDAPASYHAPPTYDATVLLLCAVFRERGA